MVSIIIPHYNRSSLLRCSIQSVLDQNIGDWEIIVIDDHSTVPEWETIKSFEDIDSRISIYQRRSLFKGPSACRNEGVAKSKYPYLIFLDSDDLLKPFCLFQRLQIMRANPQLDIAIFLEENFSEVPGDLKTNFNLNVPFDSLIPYFIENSNPWQTMAPIWKKDFFLKIGGFDEELIYMEDPELHIRALTFKNVKVKICYDLPADCYYRLNFADDTKENFWYYSIKYRIDFYEKIIEKNEKRFLCEFKKFIKKGIFKLITTFLYYRKNEFIDLNNRLFSLLKTKKVFHNYHLFLIKFLMTTGNLNYGWAKKISLKGLCFILLKLVK